MKAAAVNASILSAEFIRRFTALLHSDHAFDAYHGFGSRHCLNCGRAPRKAHQALANGDAQLDQGRVILIDDPVASADLLATPRKSGPIAMPPRLGQTRRNADCQGDRRALRYDPLPAISPRGHSGNFTHIARMYLVQMSLEFR